MSEMLDDIFSKNFLNLHDDFPPRQTQLKVSAQSRLNRSASLFSPQSPPASSGRGVSAEDIDDESVASLWSSIWSQGPPSKPKHLPFRPDRSMSLTESSSTLLSSFEHLRNLEISPSGSASTVAPPPGFPPSSGLPPQLPPMLSSNRYKTELCRGFQETGSCKYGSKCQFAHGEAELRGLYRHPKYKTEPCRTFYNFGYCPYGSRCHFIHEEKISGGPPPSTKFPNQHQPCPSASSAGSPRHQLRQSVSFAGFLGSSRSSPPPSFPSSLIDVNLGFARAPSVSPPPAALVSPGFGDSLQREAAAFQFGNYQSRASTGDIHNIPLLVEPKASRCVCGHGSDFSAPNSNNCRVFSSVEDGGQQSGGVVIGLVKPSGLRRFSSRDSLEDNYSISSGGSSGSQSPTFDGSATKRLTVFERMSVSD